MAEPAGFWSYARQDDQQTRGRIRQLAEDIRNEYSLITGDELQLFIDRETKWGEEWRRRIDDALSETTFFIPVVTPRYFKRPECRKELLQFSGHAQSLGREELLLPIYYIDVPELNQAGENSDDEAVALVARMQREDWRALRVAGRDSPEYVKKVADLATRLAEVSADIATTEAAGPVEIEQRDAELLDDGPGIFELVAEAGEAFPVLNQAFEDMTGAMEQVGEIVEGYGPKLEAASKRNPAVMLTVFRKLALELDGPAEEIRTQGHAVAASIVRIDPAVLQLVRAAELGLWESEDTAGLFSTIREYADTTARIEASISESVKEMDGAAMLSRDLKRPIRTMKEGLRSVADTKAIVEEWIRQIDRTERVGTDGS